VDGAAELHPEGDGRRALARRALHVAVSASVLYWWFPERVDEVGLTRDQLVWGGVAVMLVLEALRLGRRRIVFPMREYERRRLGGHAWLVLGCALAVVFFEQRVAMLTVLGTTLVDPLIGELRGRGHARAAPFVGLVAWVGQAVAWVLLVPLDTPWLLIPVGAAVAVAAEAVDVPHIDDNFMMNIAPLVAMAALIQFFP
jgi:hypothetical protein